MQKPIDSAWRIFLELKKASCFLTNLMARYNWQEYEAFVHDSPRETARFGKFQE